MRKKIEDLEIEEAIFNLLKKESRSMTLKEIKERLEKKGVKRSPQIILRHIENLKKQEKIIEK